MTQKPLAVLAILIMLFAPAFAQDLDARLKAAYERLDTFVAREMRRNGIPGMSLALTDRNGLLYAKTYGYADTKLRKPVTPDTEFEIGSISKSFTAISLLQLAEAGQFDPHQPITKYLPWFSIHSDYAPITGHDVMTHTAGLARDRDDIPSSLYQAAEVRDLWAGYEPGKNFAYSNIGYQIMGYLLEEITGKSSAQNVRERLLQPLGMSHSEPLFTHETYTRLATGYAPLYDDRPNGPSAPLIEATWQEYAGGDGAIVSTAADMTSYLRMLLNHGVGPNGRIISEKSFALLIQHGAEEGKDDWYGYGMSTWTADGRTYIGHDGGMLGYSSELRGDMDAGLGVIALVNFPGGPGHVTSYAMKVLRAAYENRDLPPLPEEKPPTQVKDAADFAGVYTATNGKKLILTAEGDSLQLDYAGQKIALAAYGKDSFLVPTSDFALFPLRFVRVKDKVTEAFYGGEWYAGEHYSGPRSFQYPPEWDSYPGHYRSNQPWTNNFRIVLRKGKLRLTLGDGEEWAMTPDAHGGFWAGEEDEPPREQVRCDTVVHDKTLRCILSGQGYYRTFTP